MWSDRGEPEDLARIVDTLYVRLSGLPTLSATSFGLLGCPSGTLPDHAGFWGTLSSRSTDSRIQLPI